MRIVLVGLITLVFALGCGNIISVLADSTAASRRMRPIGIMERKRESEPIRRNEDRPCWSEIGSGQVSRSGRRG